MELLVAVTLLSVILATLGTISHFSHYHVIGANRRSMLQNEISLSLEHMTKSIQQGIGTIDRPPLDNTITLPTDLTVWIDINGTPKDLDDDQLVIYRLTGNELYFIDSSEPLSGELLSSRIVDGIEFTTIPDPPVAGIYVNFFNNKTAAEIAITARHDPEQEKGVENPEIFIKTVVHCKSASYN